MRTEEMTLSLARSVLLHHHPAQCGLCPGSEYMRNLDVERFEAAVRADERERDAQRGAPGV